MDIEEKIQSWVFSPEIEELIQAFGGIIPNSLSLVERLNWIVSFSDIWDYRNRQRSGRGNSQESSLGSQTEEKARWLIDEKLTQSQEKAVWVVAEQMGLIGKQMPERKQYDFIVVLGGARMSCLFRMKYARELCTSFGIQTKEIIGLAGMRPIQETERSATDSYAPLAVTEYDLMCKAAEKVFQQEMIKEEKTILENLNVSFAVAEFGGQPPVCILAAPSTEPIVRRANTADTFAFWEKRRCIGDNKKILLITSQIYVSYQQMEAVRMLSIPKGHSVETIGFPVKWSLGTQSVHQPAHYLQEIRSTFMSMKKIME